LTLEGCSKGAAGGTPHCIAHGGDRRCQHEGCSKSAVAGGTPHCIAHGGGRRCQHQRCSKSAGTARRTAGGKRCQHEDCSKGAEGDTGYCVVHGGGKTVPARRLHQGSCPRQYATLQGAWRRQAVRAGGLHQGSRSSCRQRVLQALSPALAARRCVGRRTAIAWRGPGAPAHRPSDRR
jgi:hypothetical protein